MYFLLTDPKHTTLAAVCQLEVSRSTGPIDSSYWSLPLRKNVSAECVLMHKNEVYLVRILV